MRILGHSFIYWAQKRAAQRSYSTNLSLHLDSFRLLWKGIRDLQWYQLYFHLTRLCQIWPPPSILVIHLGGNDLGNVKTLDLLFMIKQDLHCFSIASPGTTLVFYKVVLRLSWLSSAQRRVMEKMRKRVSGALEKFMPQIGGLSYWHVDLESGYPGLYRPGGAHLLEVDIDIFNLGLQYSIEMAATFGVGRS